MSATTSANQAANQPETSTKGLTVEEKIQDVEPEVEHHPDTPDDANNPGGLPPSGGTTTDGGTG